MQVWIESKNSESESQKSNWGVYTKIDQIEELLECLDTGICMYVCMYVCIYKHEPNRGAFGVGTRPSVCVCISMYIHTYIHTR